MLRLVHICPILLYATLTLSAMHLNRLSRYDIAEADCYHEKCIELLLPILNDKNAIMDGAVLASSVLLRFYEEISSK